MGVANSGPDTRRPARLATCVPNPAGDRQRRHKAGDSLGPGTVAASDTTADSRSVATPSVSSTLDYRPRDAVATDTDASW